MEEKEFSTVVILSGGLDSTTMLYRLLADNITVKSCVSFNYGQRHKKELEFAKATCEKLGIKHHLIDLWSSGFTEAIAVSGSSLVSDNDVPEGHYGSENMKQTVVPNRNMVMLAIAGAIAVAEGATSVATGVHSGDHFIYPDCRPEFIAYASNALAFGNEGFGSLEGIIAPYMYSTKEDIAFDALSYKVPLDETWSCYKGGEKHCGKCGTCVERLEAINGAIVKWSESYTNNMTDYTEYEDEEYWKQAVAEGIK